MPLTFRFESCRLLDAPLGRNSSAHSQRSWRTMREEFRPNCVSRSDLRSNNARRMKVSRAYISKALAGDVNFSFSTACRFAKALEMDFLPGLKENDKG